MKTKYCVSVSVEKAFGFDAHGYMYSGRSKYNGQEIDKDMILIEINVKILTHEIFIFSPATPKEEHISEITY